MVEKRGDKKGDIKGINPIAPLQKMAKTIWTNGIL